MPARHRSQAYQAPQNTNMAVIFTGVAIAATVLGVIAFNQRTPHRLTPVVYIPATAASDGIAPQAARTNSSRIALSFADLTDIRKTILQ